MQSRNSTSQSARDQMNELSQRAGRANEKLIRLKMELETAEGNLARAKREAVQLFGTDDVAQLREKYRQMMSANAQALIQYEQNIAQVEQILDEVDSRIGNSNGNVQK